MKKNNGVTLTVLIVTIIITLILAGVTVTTTTTVLRSSRRKTVMSNMYLIQSKALSIYEAYQFNPNDNALAGDETTTIDSMYGVTVDTDDKWYVWDTDTLEELGLDPEMLSAGGNYIVNYVTGEVILTTGCQDDDGNRIYSLTDVIANN